LKNNPAGFFAVGVLLGGALMFAVFVFLQFQKVSVPTDPTPLPSTPNQPRLIALEPTGARPQVTSAPSLSRIRSAPSATLVRSAISPTVTPLYLRNGQQPEIIGYSGEGRAIEVYTFGDGGQEHMIVAGIHGGDEWNTVTLANQLIAHLDQNPNIIPEDGKLYILPNLNPDGEGRAHNKYGRLNHNGVDLNRNFPVNWLADWDRSGCWNSLPTSGGTGPGSEAETQALMDFISRHNVQALISYHSAALGIFPGGFPWDEEASRLAQALAEVTSYRFPPLDTGCTYSGTLADYAVSMGIAAVDLELTNHIDTDFDENLQALDVLLNFVP
jgi:predicted deacylase